MSASGGVTLVAGSQRLEARGSKREARSAHGRGAPLRLVVLCLMTMVALAVEDIAVTPDAVVERGLAGLVKLQQADGSIGDGAGITGLAGMALLSGGHTPTRGRYRDASAKALRYVLGRQDKLTGYLGADMGNMYAHGFATLYLAESYGMTPDPQVRRALEAAIDLIHRCQNHEGGWRYVPAPLDADISVTIAQVMALRAAWNVGIGGQTSQEVIAKAVQYVQKCANADGSFNYTVQSGPGWGTSGADGVPRCAAGSMCLIGAGINDLKHHVLGPALGFLVKNYKSHLQGRGEWYWYGQYYCAQAMFHHPDFKQWQLYYNDAWRIIAGFQGVDGLWHKPDSYGPAFGTAIALIILQIPNNYLPIFQR